MSGIKTTDLEMPTRNDDAKAHGVTTHRSQSSPMNILLIVMVVMSLLVNLISLAVIAYLTAYTVDKVGGFETSMDVFLPGGSDTSWADVVNKQLRTDYTSLFREVSPGLTRL
eukprot:CAMPEP_0198226910 /NCGR_PEP_ID=MMETSP1445-20131203/107065_1 /TAXON_ID=36898 /ORGANISM="Pyramimonas sp., Strain CCMP2087" /LENGTH=111 /DNA_ID=CAMNT_0043906827 /DNA_START=27 /DNA_END=358 /DNA_ORIENTATION=+